MTRDEMREKCIGAMEDAFYTRSRCAPASIYNCMAAAFDALHGIARVCPVEATEEMREVGYRANVQKNPPDSLYQRVWQAMSTAGDLTNPLEVSQARRIIIQQFHHKGHPK